MEKLRTYLMSRPLSLSGKAEESLLALGLNKYESRVYLTLVAEGVSTAKNISDITNIPYGKVYEIINSLALKGFVISLPTKPMKCRAISPKEAIKTAKNNLTNKLKKVEDVVLSEIEPLFARSKEFVEPKGIFWILNGRSILNKKMEEMVGKAKSHIHIYTSANGFKRLRAVKSLLRNAKRRGISITITSQVSKDNRDVSNLFNFCNRKHAKCTHSTLFSVDGEGCLLIEPIPDDDSMYYGRDLGVWVANDKFVKFIEHLYESNFNNSESINGTKN